MKKFKLLQGQSSFASEFLAYAERIINEGRYGVYRIGQDEPPFNLSLRHWNILPQDLRGATLQEMECFIRGWEDARNAVHINPFEDAVRGELWNRGYWRFINRVNPNYRNVNPNPPIDETYPEYYNTEDFEFVDVTEVRYDEETYVPYKRMLFRHIEEGNTIEGNRISPVHPMYNFPDII